MNPREEKPIGLSVGSASMIMIFAILCITVFSALSFATAVAERKTAERFAETTAEYYQADSEATRIKKEIEKSLIAGAGAGEAAAAQGAVYDQDNETISYGVELKNGSSRLDVELGWDGSEFRVKRWEKTELEAWNAPTDLEVWDGEE